MTDNPPGNRNTILVTGGIIAVFLIFLLTLVIPFGAIFLFILAGVVILMVVVLSNGTLGSQQKTQEPPAKEPETPLLRKDLFELILIAVAIGVTLVSPVVRRWLNADTYIQFFLFFAGVLVILQIVRYIADVRAARAKGNSMPNPGTNFYLPLARKGLLLFGAFIGAFFLFEVFDRNNAGQSIPEFILIELAILVFLWYLNYQVYRYFKPRPHVVEGSRGSVLSNILEFLTGIARYLAGNLLGYILAAAVLNGCLALVVLLAGKKVIDLDLTHANGFILFLVFAFGNLLIFALVLLKLERTGCQPPSDAEIPVTSGSSLKYLTPKGGTAIMGIIMVAFLAVFFICPFLAAGYIFEEKPPAPSNKYINIVVEHPDPSKIIVYYYQGSDSEKLVFLEAMIYDRNATLMGRSTLGSERSKIPIKPNQNIVFEGFPEHSRILIRGHFSDGTTQVVHESLV